MTRQELVEAIKNLKENEGFDVRMQFVEGEDGWRTLGIRYLKIIDVECMVFGGYGTNVKMLDHMYSHWDSDAEETANQFLKYANECTEDNYAPDFEDLFGEEIFFSLDICTIEEMECF